MYNHTLHFFFSGIGGSGMSGLAEILLGQGFKVSGSDLRTSPVVERLCSLGADVKIGHAASNLAESVSLIVYSSAVRQDNPELCEARSRGLPVVRRAEVLAELMRLKFGVAVAGSHGKTTTTSMVAHVMESAGMDPTVVIGGLVRSIGSHATASGAKLGHGNFLVAETDESDRSFLLLKPTLAVVTNIDAEHMNAYESLADLERAFEQFLSAVPFYGLAVLCIDDPKVRSLAQRYERRKTTYGFSPDAHVRATDVSHDRGLSHYTVWRGTEELGRVTLSMPGRHMVQNSLVAFAVGLEFGLDPRVIAEALGRFSGVGRRLEIVGESGGVLIMNDYGHHPTEIAATLRAVRDGWGGRKGKIRVVFQPHRYSRTQSCFAQFLDAFRDADDLFLTEIYAASEDPINGVSGELLAGAVNHPSKRFRATPEECMNDLMGELGDGDVVVCLGAGSIGALPEKLLAEWQRRGGR